jgi:hypothetical protein
MLRRTIGWGIVLIVVGLWIWLSALGVPYIDFGCNWPLLMVAFGVYVIVRKTVRRARRLRRPADVIADLESGRIDVDKAVVEIRRSR